MGTGTNTRGKKIRPDDRDRIIELRLAGVSYRDIAAEVGVDKDTVGRHWSAYLDDVSESRRGQLERFQSELLVRLSMVAQRARQDWNRAEEHADRARYLAEERQAYREMARVGGLDQLTITAKVIEPAMTDDEARRRLALLPATD